MNRTTSFCSIWACLVLLFISLTSHLLGEVRYDFTLVATSGDVVSGQTLGQVYDPILLGDSVAYTAHNDSLGYFVVKDGRILASRNSQVSGRSLTGVLEGALSLSPSVAFTGRLSNNELVVVRDGNVVAGPGSRIDGLTIMSAFSPSLWEEEMAYVARGSENDYHIVRGNQILFSSGETIQGIPMVEVGTPSISGRNLSFAARDANFQLFVVRNQEIAAGPGMVVDGQLLSGAFEPSLSTLDLAYTGLSDELGQFVVVGQDIVARQGDVIGGLTVQQAFQPALDSTGKRLAIAFSHSRGSAIAVGEGTFRTYFAQVADGGGVFTDFSLLNLGESDVYGTLQFVSPDGSPRTVTVEGQSGSQFNLEIPINGSVRITTEGSGQQALPGWAVLETDGPVRGMASYEYRIAGQLATRVSVSGEDPVYRATLTVDNQTQSDTGIAVANVADHPVRVRMTLRDQSGREVATRIDPRFDPLGVNHQVADFVTAFFPQVNGIHSFKGTLTVEVEGEGRIIVSSILLKEGLYNNVPVIQVE
ncbi:MAG TPA: hypothetical protein VKZ59_06655 [Acidobacteriota bacterium]|nr:hypothetical protein [Acidobacteriota bacterium]